MPAAHFDGEGLTDEQIARLMHGSTPYPGDTLAEPALLARPLGELPATYIQCVLTLPELDDDVAELLNSRHWRLVKIDTDHWPMYSQPRELAQILVDAAGT
ncbi:hypothetical protein [Streptomyces sp. NPDC048462]|uniref:hypothetical protein n=1 Tax=Streptomyces sp. NPDC048462 TaxID=3365555 RepID=UPI00371F6F4A